MGLRVGRRAKKDRQGACPENQTNYLSVGHK